MFLVNGYTKSKEKRTGVLKDIKCSWWLEASLENMEKTMVQGFSQKYGEDYGENFSPVTKMILVCMGLALAIFRNCKLW